MRKLPVPIDVQIAVLADFCEGDKNEQAIFILEALSKKNVGKRCIVSIVFPVGSGGLHGTSGAKE